MILKKSLRFIYIHIWASETKIDHFRNCVLTSISTGRTLISFYIDIKTLSLWEKVRSLYFSTYFL